MSLTAVEVISLIKIIGNNLLIGRSMEQSVCIAISNLPSSKWENEKWIQLINLGIPYQEVFMELANSTEDKSLSRVWILLSKMALLSSYETGQKLVEIAENLDVNKRMSEKRKSLIKAQRYKFIFLGAITALFLGVIAAFAPLFVSLTAIFRNVTASPLALTLTPVSFYFISVLSTYFINEANLGRFSFKPILFSTIAYLSAYFVTKGILLLLSLGI